LHAFLEDALELAALEELQAKLKAIREFGNAARREVASQHEVAPRGVESAGCEDLAALLRFTVPLRLDLCSTFKIRHGCRAVKSCASRGKWPGKVTRAPVRPHPA
jgi:hypothetical protein